jgi:hypothetical protein
LASGLQGESDVQIVCLSSAGAASTFGPLQDPEKEMMSKRPLEDEAIRKIDEAIRDRVRETDEYDSLGNPVAAVPASDKHGLALQVGVELADVEERMEAICEEVPAETKFAAVPRYRLRSQSASDLKRPPAD